MADVVPFRRFVLGYEAGLLLAENRHPSPRVIGQSTGWKRWIWTKDRNAATTFGSAVESQRFAEEWLPDGWRPIDFESLVSQSAQPAVAS